MNTTLGNSKYDSVTRIVNLAGGKIVGRTRLQKVAYLLKAAGFEDDFDFEYKHYGPYSAELASSAKIATLLGTLSEIEQPASWGGTYSIFELTDNAGSRVDPATQFASTASNSDAVDLELAATAVFLSKEGFQDPWEETKRRKPEKVALKQGFDGAMQLLRQLKAIETPSELPRIV